MTVPRILDLIKTVNGEMYVNMKTSQGLKAEICSRSVLRSSLYPFRLSFRAMGNESRCLRKGEVACVEVSSCGLARCWGAWKVVKLGRGSGGEGGRRRR